MNRREVLTGMAFAGVAAAVPAAAVASQPDRAAWDRAMADYKRAYAASDAFDEELWRITGEYQAAVEHVPHVAFESPYHGRGLSTADRHEVSLARHEAKNLRYVEACAYDGVKARQRLVDAADERDAVISEIDRRTGYSAAHDKADALSAAIGDAETVLLDMPAPDGEALMWKVNRLYKPGEGLWSDGVEDQTIADLQRFLLQGRA